MSDSGRADALLAALPRNGRGRLKVFLGAAPGVGKTYAMLQAAHTQQRQGVKLLAGIVQTHARAETEALLVGLPQQPMLRSLYREVPLEEMDLDGLLKAKPQLVLVDELAHSNAPGSRHAKRWQDVQELLAANIDVYTTINVQHLESLNDQVRGITGVQVRETVPDWVLQEAYEMLLIDLPPRELLERLRDGKVYVPEQARSAIDAFFSQTNLNALRELAMQTAAAQVDADLTQGYRRLGQDAPTVRGRLLVAIDSDGQCERLVRHASRIAQSRHLPWSVVHIDNGGVKDESALQRLHQAQQLAERLGGEVVVLRASGVARALIQHANDRRAGLLLLGQSRRRVIGMGLSARLLRESSGLEINVLPRLDSLLPRRTHRTQRWRWSDYALAFAATLLASGVAWGVSMVMDLPNISLVFLASVLLVAVRSSVGPALASAMLSFMAYDFLFIPPYFSFNIQREEDILTLMFFLLMAALTGNLAARQRRQFSDLREAQAQTARLLELSRSLAASTDRQAVLNAASQHLQGWPGLQICLLEKTGDVWTIANGGSEQFSESERAAGEWAGRHDQAAGMSTGTLPAGRWWWWPVSLDGQVLAMMAVSERHEGALNGEVKRLLGALGQPLAQALARANLVHDLEAARLHGETEQLRSALLASVSHDLRTPLTSMRGSIDSLLELGEVIGASDRVELLQGTRDEAERLDRYIQNLLDMTRLGHGALKLARDWVAPSDIVASALARLRTVLAGLKVRMQIPSDTPLLYVHAALIEQALVNVLENAARFSPLNGRIEIAASVHQEFLVFSVSDEGPGIPKEERAKIFDMFYTAARGDRGGQGTGLGLAICQGMVGAHGGRVVVGDGIDGKGSCIALWLPLPAQPHAELEMEP